MKIEDIDKVNHLVGELNGMKELIAHAEHGEPADFEAIHQAARRRIDPHVRRRLRLGSLQRIHCVGGIP